MWVDREKRAGAEECEKETPGKGEGETGTGFVGGKKWVYIVNILLQILNYLKLVTVLLQERIQ